MQELRLREHSKKNKLFSTQYPYPFGQTFRSWGVPDHREEIISTTLDPYSGNIASSVTGGP